VCSVQQGFLHLLIRFLVTTTTRKARREIETDKEEREIETDKEERE